MFKSMDEGIWQCEGCGKTYPEYVNGCVEDHGRPRGVVLVVPEQPNTDQSDYAAPKGRASE